MSAVMQAARRVGRGGRGGPGRKGERGVALLMVLSLLALLGSVVADFQFSSRIDLQLAINARDELQAEYNALSAVRLRMLLLHNSKKVTSLIQQTGLGDNLPPIGQMLEMIPVECGLMSAITREAGTGLGDDTEGGGDFFPGECLATSESEHSKIPVNLLGNALGQGATWTASLLLALLSDLRLERHFQEDDRNGTRAENPAELVAALTDWVDRNHVETGSSAADEDRHYANLRDSYRVKNAPFDSLDEVQLVHGIDDELWSILRPNLSIHVAEPKIELGTASEQRIMMGLFGALREGIIVDELLLPRFAELIRSMQELRAASFGMLPMNLTVLNGLVTGAGLGSVIDTTRLNKIFSDSSSTTWYTVEAEGRVGNATRRIRSVVQTAEGKFYYFRVE